MDVGFPSVIGPQLSSYIALCSHATTLTATIFILLSVGVLQQLSVHKIWRSLQRFERPHIIHFYPSIRS